MVPFIQVLLNSFKQKRDSSKIHFPLSQKGIYTCKLYKSIWENGIHKSVWKLPVYHRLKHIARHHFRIYGSILFYPCKKYIFQSILCTDGSIHDHSIPGDHDPVSFHLRFRTSYVKPQTDTVFMHTGFALSMSVFIYQGFIKSGIPLSLEEAAYLDGCTNVQTFFKVVFPLLKPTTATLVS